MRGQLPRENGLKILSFRYLIAFTSQSVNISYELPMSIEFNNGTVNVSQMMVAKRGLLKQAQLNALQATVS